MPNFEDPTQEPKEETGVESEGKTKQQFMKEKGLEIIEIDKEGGYASAIAIIIFVEDNGISRENVIQELKEDFQEAYEGNPSQEEINTEVEKINAAINRLIEHRIVKEEAGILDLNN